MHVAAAAQQVSSFKLLCSSVPDSAVGSRAPDSVELCGPYPGNLCQVCVHVLVADLHHLPDALVVAAGGEGLWMEAGGECMGEESARPWGLLGIPSCAPALLHITHSSTIFL